MLLIQSSNVQWLKSMDLDGVDLMGLHQGFGLSQVNAWDKIMRKISVVVVIIISYFPHKPESASFCLPLFSLHRSLFWAKLSISPFTQSHWSNLPLPFSLNFCFYALLYLFSQSASTLHSDSTCQNHCKLRCSPNNSLTFNFLLVHIKTIHIHRSLLISFLNFLSDFTSCNQADNFIFTVQQLWLFVLADKIKRAAKQSGNLRENSWSLGSSGSEVNGFHVLSGESLILISVGYRCDINTSSVCQFQQHAIMNWCCANIRHLGSDLIITYTRFDPRPIQGVKKLLKYLVTYCNHFGDLRIAKTIRFYQNFK